MFTTEHCKYVQYQPLYHPLGVSHLLYDFLVQYIKKKCGKVKRFKASIKGRKEQQGASLHNEVMADFFRRSKM